MEKFSFFNKCQRCVKHESYIRVVYMLKKQLFWLITVLLIILVGCSEDKKNAEDSPESSYNGNGKTKNPPETTEEAKHIYPFTGEETDGDVGQRMIGVMVNNHPEARPQKIGRASCRERVKIAERAGGGKSNK